MLSNPIGALLAIHGPFGSDAASCSGRKGCRDPNGGACEPKDKCLEVFHNGKTVITCANVSQSCERDARGQCVCVPNGRAEFVSCERCNCHDCIDLSQGTVGP
jgi:hypothetical protein